jgi:DNA-binding CsgD family transcriptional regulator
LINKLSKREQKIARAREVQELHIGGMSSVEIADFLGISARTVWRDRYLVKQLNRTEARTLNHDECLGERLTILQGIRTKALQDYQLCPAHSTAKVGFLNAALRAEDKIIQLLLKVGAIVQTPEPYEVGGDIPWEKPGVRQAYLTFLKLARETGDKNPEL